MGLIRGLIRAFEGFLNHYSYITESIYSVIDSADSTIDKELIDEREHEADAILRNCVKYFLETDATRFLLFVRDINTKNMYSHISSRLLYTLVRMYDIRKVSELSDKLANGETKIRLEDILAVINAYSARHFDRLREFQKRCAFLQFLVSKVGYLYPKKQTTGDAEDN